MSKIVKDPNGSLRVQFSTGDGRRLGIRLGIRLTDDLSAKAREAARRKAEAFREKVDQIRQDILLARPHDDDLARWIRGLELVKFSAFPRDVRGESPVPDRMGVFGSLAARLAAPVAEAAPIRGSSARTRPS